MATIKAITSVSVGSGYYGEEYVSDLFWVSNAIVVPSSFSSISYSFTINGTDSSSNAYIDSYTDGVYFSTTTSGNSYGNNLLTYSNLQSYKGKTIYLFVMRSAANMGIEPDYLYSYSGSGYVAFNTSSDTLTVTIKTFPALAQYDVTCLTSSYSAVWSIEGGSSGSSFKVPAGYKISVVVYLTDNNYVEQTESYITISSTTTLYYFLRHSSRDLNFGSSTISNCYLGNTKVKAIAMGNAPVYVDPDLEA